MIDAFRYGLLGVFDSKPVIVVAIILVFVAGLRLFGLYLLG